MSNLFVSTRSQGSTPLGVPVTLKGTVSDAPKGLERFLSGDFLRGTVLGQDDQNRLLVRTDLGVLKIITKTPLPPGTEVTLERLSQVDRGEEALRALGFRQTRLRHHGDIARVEIAPEELAKALDPEMARAIVAAIKPLGFRYVALDLEGYRTGALNEGLVQIEGLSILPVRQTAS